MPELQTKTIMTPSGQMMRFQVDPSVDTSEIEAVQQSVQQQWKEPQPPAAGRPTTSDQRPPVSGPQSAVSAQPSAVSPLTETYPALGDKISKAKGAGYSDQEIQKFVQGRIHTATKAGYSVDEIQNYLGRKGPTTGQKLAMGPVGSAAEFGLSAVSRAAPWPDVWNPENWRRRPGESIEQARQRGMEMIGNVNPRAVSESFNYLIGKVRKFDPDLAHDLESAMAELPMHGLPHVAAEKAGKVTTARPAAAVAPLLEAKIPTPETAAAAVGVKPTLTEVAQTKKATTADRGPLHDAAVRAIESTKPGEQIRFPQHTDETFTQTSKWAERLPQNTIVEDANGMRWRIGESFLESVDERGNPTGNILTLKKDGKWAPDKNALPVLGESKVVSRPQAAKPTVTAVATEEKALRMFARDLQKRKPTPGDIEIARDIWPKASEDLKQGYLQRASGKKPVAAPPSAPTVPQRTPVDTLALVKSALTKNPAQWTAAEADAVQRSSGRGITQPALTPTQIDTRIKLRQQRADLEARNQAVINDAQRIVDDPAASTYAKDAARAKLQELAALQKPPAKPTLTEVARKKTAEMTPRTPEEMAREEAQTKILQQGLATEKPVEIPEGPMSTGEREMPKVNQVPVGHAGRRGSGHRRPARQRTAGRGCRILRNLEAARLHR